MKDDILPLQVMLLGQVVKSLQDSDRQLRQNSLSWI
jgi:hypothetical protein